jgi:hypothetical protein
MADEKMLRKGFKPRAGGTVRLWDAPRGLWVIWSKGSKAGTWFIQPLDDTARHELANSAHLASLAEQVWSYAAEVKINVMGEPSVVDRRRHGR